MSVQNPWSEITSFEEEYYITLSPMQNIFEAYSIGAIRNSIHAEEFNPFRCKYETTAIGQEAWFDGLQEDKYEFERFLAIRIDGTLIGTISWKYIELFKKVELGQIMLAKAYRGRKIIQTAIKLLLNVVPHKKAVLYVKVGNKVAIAAYKKAGFRVVKHEKFSRPETVKMSKENEDFREDNNDSESL